MNPKTLKWLFVLCAMVITPILRASNVISYTATNKLSEVTETRYSGLHTNAFNVSIISHLFDNGQGVITFAGNVTSIGEYAFNGCFSLISITIPNSVTSIGEAAFSDCIGLTSITISNSVTSIGEGAFSLVNNVVYSGTAKGKPWGAKCINGYIEGFLIYSDASKTTLCGYSPAASGSVTIPNSVTCIKDWAFDGCTALTSINVDATNTYYSSVEGVLFNYAKDKLIQYPAGNPCTTYTIPNNVTSIGTDAFAYCISLTSITIPNSVTSIGNSAFYYCTSLTSITIPCSVTYIDCYAFDNCNSLTSISFWNNNPISDLCWTTQNLSLVYVPYSAIEHYRTAWSSWAKVQPISFDNVIVSVNNTASGSVDTIIDYRQRMITENMWDTIGTLTAKPNYGYHFTQWSDGNTDNPRVFILPANDTIFTAVFERDTFTITTQSAQPQLGHTIGDTTILYLDTIFIEAIPNYGYTFYWWNDSKNGWDNNPRKIVVKESGTYTAEFQKRTFNISKQYNYQQGTILGADDAQYLDETTLTASPKYGYHFTRWGDGNTDNPRSFIITQDTSFEALFAKNLYTISAVANDSVRGVVLGDTTVEYIETISISATPNYGYNFTRWNDGNTNNPRQVQVTGDKTYTAQFDKNTYYITKIANSTFGQISGSSAALYLDEVSLSVSSNCGAYFTQWSDGNTDNPRSFILAQDTTFEAQFALYYSGQCGDNATWQYTNDTLTISGAGALYSYTSTTMPWVLLRDSISAIVLDSGITSIGDYCFYGCSLVREITFGEKLTSIGSYAFAGCNNIRSITCLASSLVSIQSTTMNGVSNYAKVNVLPTLEEDYQFDVNWSRFVIVAMGNMFTVTTSATNGSVTGAGKYLENSSVTLTATANMGYHFTQWRDGNTSNPRSVVVTKDTTFEAQFAKNVYSITTAVNDPARGVVEGDTTVEYMETISISATPNYGYHFTQWDDGNANNPRQIQVTNNKTFTAQFDKNQYTISTAKDANISSVTDGGTYNYLDEVELTVVANVNCQFDHWSDGNTDNPRTLIVTQDTTLMAFSSKIRSGTCGDNLTWDYADGILVVSGTGAMYDYTQGTAPWMALYKDSITNVVINNGCTSIGNFAFYGLSNKNFKTLDLPNSILSIGQFAFAECAYLKSISLGSLLEQISASAFANDNRLLSVVCFAEEPPLLNESAFANYDIYLKIPCESKSYYKVATGWKKFNQDNVSCIGAEETTVTNDEVTVSSQTNDAAFTWPTNTQAASYSLQITKDGVVFCTLTFNSLGQLVGLAFAPGRGASVETTEQAAVQTAQGFTFTVTGLNSASIYAFNMDVKDSGNQTIKSYTGTFQTKGGVVTNLDNQLSDSPYDRFTKIIKDGQLLILRDNKTYNAQGGEL